MLPTSIFFDNFFNDFNDRKYYKMNCDIYEEDENYNLIIDVPGYSKDEINIEFNNGILNITCEKNEENEDKNYIRKERCYRKCERSFNFGDVDADKIKAEYNNGVLRLSIPKIKNIDTKKNIEIN